MSIVGPMYGFVAALFTRMSTRPEALDRRGDARLGLVGLTRVRDRPRHLAVDARRRGLERVRLAGREHHAGAARRELGRDREPDAARRAGDERDLAVEADVHRPAAKGRGRSGRSLARTRWRGRPARAGSGTPPPGSRPRTRHPGANSTWSPASTLRTVGPTWMTSAQTRRRWTSAVAGMRMPGAGLALTELVGRLHEQAVGGHADRLLRLVARIEPRATARIGAGSAMARRLPLT